MTENKYKIIIIGGSAGSFHVVKKVLSSLQPHFQIPLVLCLHRLRGISSGFVESLRLYSRIQVKEPEDKDPVVSNRIYLCPANYHVLIEREGFFALSVDEAENYSRPSIDVTFESASLTYRDKMIAILLSGANADGARGMAFSVRNGAYSVVQDPSDSLFGIMPGEALKRCNPDKIMTTGEIIEFLTSLTTIGHVAHS